MIFSHSIKSQVKCAHLWLGHLSFFHWKAANGIWSGQEIQIHCEELPTIFLKMLNWKYGVIKHISRLFASLDTIKKKSFSVTLFLFLYSNRSWTTTKQYAKHSLHRIYRNISVT